MPYVKIPLLPGVFKDDTPLAAEGFFVDADKIRFVRGKAQTIGGWETVASTRITGLCRGVHTWKDNTTLAYAALGTNTNLHCYFDGSIYDITPVVSRGQLTNPFSTTNLSTSVNVAHTAHGRLAGDGVNFLNATAVGGLTISGDYPVTTVVDANNYTITAASAATSTAGPGGGTVDDKYYLAVGLADSLGGAGYGAGGWGVGNFGVTNAGTYYARSWSLDNWGQNLLANPRGGAIYEWSPLFTQTELVTNGDMASATGWTVGTGWTIAAGTATAVAATGSDLSTVIALNASAYFILEFDITRSAGTCTVYVGTTAITAALALSQHVKQVFFTLTGILKFTKDAAFAGTIDNVTIKQIINGTILPNAPTQNTCFLVTPERIVMAGGSIDSQTTAFNPLHVRWSDQDYNLALGLPGSQIWTATATNQAGFFTLAKGGRIVGMKNGNGEVLIWTDDGLYGARYIPDPNIVYSFRLIASGCGLIGPNAVAMHGGIAYWMSPSGEFYRYAGGVPEPLQSTCRRDVFDNLAQVQGDKVYAFSVSAYGNVGWLYPDFRDGNECSRYILYCIADNAWAPGTFDRTAWIDAGVIPYPIAPASTGYVYFQEKGNSADGSALTWRLRAAAFDIGSGDTLFQVDSIIPDMDDLLGGFSATFRGYTYPNATATSYGPYSITSSSPKTDLGPVFPIGRQTDFEFTGNSAPAFMRMGSIRLSLTDTGMTN